MSKLRNSQAKPKKNKKNAIFLIATINSGGLGKKKDCIKLGNLSFLLFSST